MTALAEVPPLVTTLSSLAHDANVELAAIEANDADSLQRAIRVGEYLIEAKSRVPHGQWRVWTRENITGCTSHSTYLYMRLARNQVAIRHCISIREAQAELQVCVDADAYYTPAARRERQARAVKMRGTGATYPEIGAALGVSRTRAWQLANPEEYAEKSAAQERARRAVDVAARKALAEKRERAAIKRFGGQPEVMYSAILKACESAGRLASEKPEQRAEADAILADLYRAKDRIVALVGAS